MPIAAMYCCVPWGLAILLTPDMTKIKPINTRPMRLIYALSVIAVTFLPYRSAPKHASYAASYYAAWKLHKNFAQNGRKSREYSCVAMIMPQAPTPPDVHAARRCAPLETAQLRIWSHRP